MIEELRVSEDGQATLTVGIDGKPSSFAIGEQELERLRTELEAADLADPDLDEGGPGCADCFEYAIESQGQEVALDDLDRPGEPLRALLDHLSELVAGHHPAGAAEPGGD